MWIEGERTAGTAEVRGPLGRILGLGRALRVKVPQVVARIMDAERHHLALWAPVAFGLGAAIYFGLGQEPDLRLLGAAALVAALAWRLTRHHAAGVVAAAIALLLLGLLAAGFRSHMVSAPVLERRLPPQMVTARVQMVEHMGPRQQRLTLGVDHMSRLPPEKWPARIRISVRTGGDEVRPGDRVSVLAALWPPPAPSIPTDFDFARQLWFKGIGGLGVAVAPVERLEGEAADGTFAERFMQRVEQLRLTISARIHAALPAEQAAIADALVTGYRAALSAETNEAMRRSGLFHILSISGMHMSMVTGLVFFMLRAGFAAIEPLALRQPIKKWAAFAAIAAALGYLFISGADVPAQRSFLMSALVLTAVICDRRAISLRMVTVAGFLVLLFQPESLLGPSFQMSFAAVVALIAGYEFLRQHRPAALLPRGILGKILGYMGALALSSIIAELAITPASLYHFNEMPLLGLVANAIAVPVLGAIVMPGLILGVVTMPLGIEALPLWVVGQGIELIRLVAFQVGAFSTAIIKVPAVPFGAYCLIMAGGLWLCLWRSALRLAGLLLIAAGILQAALAPLPDILVEGEGDLVAFVGEDGRFWQAPGRASSFARKRWTRMSGREAARWEWKEAQLWKEGGDWTLQPTAEQAEPARWLTCDGAGCLFHARPDLTVAIVNAPDAFPEDCASARIVIAREWLPRWCQPELAIGRRERRAEGGQVIYLETDAAGRTVIRRETVADRRSGRPWGSAP